jgi:hypothetical protein
LPTSDPRLGREAMLDKENLSAGLQHRIPPVWAALLVAAGITDASMFWIEAW